ncbi:hypothetical protein QUV91_00505 [Actinomyces viscosus]|uniref:NACHT domain-containing protein n=2 Tax=Actinomycetes TaxID=1760 RepID=A0ABT7TUM9_ACTVI|nr:hypothetical protein [Actinomyces viscosus]MDM8075534.1 hypothetical protein [Actinomyces viscosus]
MAAMDRDTFIPLGTSIVKLLLIASGQGALATAVGEGAGLLAKFRRTLEIGGIRAVFAERIADDAAKQLLREHQGISEADWHVAARQAASLIDQLSEKERLAAGYNWEELRRTLLDLGGTDLRSGLADESTRQAFDWVLEVACQRIADCFTEKEALASIFDSVEEVRAAIQRLADRPAGASQTRAVVADHLEVVRDLAPDPLEDREREIAELTAFVHGGPDAWYAMEAGMISGKTALMSSFTLNPPSDVHIVSFFIRRMGGDGNDWRSFSFVAGAQLAEILGDEYTERVSEPASQNTEFRQLLRRAATACQSDKNPRPLVLVIDGVDEDSYYEDPDAPGAKSILSLLPRHLPEGVKLVTASRSNPRMPEDTVCNASRVVVSLKPSPIAQEKINQKDIETFFKSDLAVDIGAFLAACGGSLTVDELRQLIARRRHVDNVPSRDVKACVDHSPGRMLMRVNVGFGDREIPSYTLGHDAVLRAVLREISPDLFGEDNSVEDEAWWAKTREIVLKPYIEEVCAWVSSCINNGWSHQTPLYLLSNQCVDVVCQHLNECIEGIIDKGRYVEIARRYGTKSRVLRSIDEDCSKLLNSTSLPISEPLLAKLCEVSEERRKVAAASAFIPGTIGVRASLGIMTARTMVLEILAIDDSRKKLMATIECLKFAPTAKWLSKFSEYLSTVISTCRFDFYSRDEATLRIISVLVEFCISSNRLKGGSGGECIFSRQSYEIASSVAEEFVDNLDEQCGQYAVGDAMLCRISNEVHDSTVALLVALKLASSIHQVSVRLEALTKFGGVLMCANLASMAREVANSIAELVTSIEGPSDRAVAMARASAVLADAGLNSRAREVGTSIAELVTSIEGPSDCAVAMARASAVLADAGLTDLAQELADVSDAFVKIMHIHIMRSDVLVVVVTALVDAGLIIRAREVSEQIGDAQLRAQALAKVASAFADRGLIDEAQVIACEMENSLEQADAPQIDGDTLIGVVCGLVDVGLFIRAREVSEQIGDAQLRAQALAKVASAFADRGLIDEAQVIACEVESVLEQADAAQVDVETLFGVTTVLTSAGLAERAQKILELSDFSSICSDFQVDAVVALLDVGLVDSAYSLCKMIGESRLRARALAKVAGALANVGLTDRAREAADAAEDAGWQIDARLWRAEALAEVAATLANSGLVSWALRLSKRIEEGRSQSYALYAVVDGLLNDGNICDAKELVGQIDNSRLRALGQVKIAAALASGGFVEQARVMFDCAEESVSRDDGFGWRQWVLVDVAKELFRAGVIERGSIMVERIYDPSLHLIAQLSKAEVLMRLSEYDEAIKVIECEMFKVESSLGREDVVSCLGAVARFCCDSMKVCGGSTLHHDRWCRLVQSVLVRAWLYGASVWDSFDVLVRVAPELAVRLVDERILADPEQGTAPESDPDLGPEGPGGDTGSYR